MSELTVWKYPISIEDHQTIDVGGKITDILMVGLDPNGTPCVWVELVQSISGKTSPLELVLIGTGHRAPTREIHIGSFVHASFVWHAYAMYMKSHRSAESD